MLVLGIESTCDETACSIVEDGKEILSSVISSQIDLHTEYGGVVPELACRRHVDLLIPVLQEAIEKAEVSLKEIDLIAVAHGPGLIGALLLGLSTAKSLSLALNKPFIGVNHVEAHLYATLMSRNEGIRFPCLGVVLSGGHTAIVRMDEIGQYQLISQTVDDAIGEAFDKVAKILGLPYPGGPQIEKLAKEGNSLAYPFKPGRVKKQPLDFSFSGIKTGVLYAVKGQNSDYSAHHCQLSYSEKVDICASFQHVVFQDIIQKTVLAANESGIDTVVLGGGVTNNRTLRKLFSENDSHRTYLWPSEGLSLDNAAMIAGLGYHKYLAKGCGDALDLEALTRISLAG